MQPKQELLNQWNLADRWHISPRTLERWRWEGKGPHYLKIGNRIAYRLEDIEAYEAEHRLSPAVVRLGRKRRTAHAVSNPAA